MFEGKITACNRQVRHTCSIIGTLKGQYVQTAVDTADTAPTSGLSGYRLLRYRVRGRAYASWLAC